ncbi:MAG: O-antigen ligase family protein [Candidatus Aminicenantales bacterium]
MARLQPCPAERSSEVILLIPFLAGLFFNLISISLSQAFYGLCLLLWLFLLVRRRLAFETPSFFWPLLVYAGLSLISSALSVNPLVSFRDSRELLIFLLIPLTLASLSSRRGPELAKYVLLTSGGLNLVYGLVVYFGGNQGGSRLRGFMGHYMTEAGLLMLLIIFSLSQTLFSSERLKWAWAGLAAGSGFLLLLTLTRSAWLGVGVGVVLLVGLWRPKALVFLPFIFAAIYWLSPFEVKRRIMNTFNLYSPSNHARLEYYRAGIQVVKDWPLFGCGPDTVDMVFQNPKYNLSAQAKLNVHLHNNLLQLAAERGLLALASWLAFMVWSLRLLWKKWRTKPAGNLSFIAAALASEAALFFAGLFEYNFGDSEVVMFYLVLLTLPLALGRRQQGKPA